MLQVKGLNVYYGQRQILHGINFYLMTGEILVITGHNGAGRSTLAKALMGLIANVQGFISLDGVPLLDTFSEKKLKLSPYIINRLGICYVPEIRDVFKSLTVQEHFELSISAGKRNYQMCRHKQTIWTLEHIFHVFPRLKDKQTTMAGALSGGEQQMLSVARALLLQPKLLILDEPFEGLAQQAQMALVECFQSARQNDTGILLIEQKNTRTQFADRRIALFQGEIQGGADAVNESPRL